MSNKVKPEIVMFVGKVSDKHRQQMIERRTWNGVAPIVVQFDPYEFHRSTMQIEPTANPGTEELLLAVDGIDEELLDDTVLNGAIENLLSQWLGDVRIEQIHTVVYPEDASNDWEWLRPFLSKRAIEFVAKYYEDGSGRILFDRSQTGVRVL